MTSAKAAEVESSIGASSLWKHWRQGLLWENGIVAPWKLWWESSGCGFTYAGNLGQMFAL